MIFVQSPPDSDLFFVYDRVTFEKYKIQIHVLDVYHDGMFVS